MAEANTAAQAGIVTSADAQKYRVKVFLPLLGIETGWIRVCSSYVGAGWGLVTLPQVGNEVLVIFLNGDLNEGTVAGTLYSEGADTPPGLAEYPSLIHESGSKIVLARSGDITIEAKGNLFLRGATIHLNDDK